MDFFEGIVIPNVTYYTAFAVVTVVLTEVIKKIIRYKPAWAFLPVIFGVIFGIVTAYLQRGEGDFAAEAFKAAFCIAGGAIGSYDIIVKKLKDWKSKSEEADNANKSSEG